MHYDLFPTPTLTCHEIERSVCLPIALGQNHHYLITPPNVMSNDQFRQCEWWVWVCMWPLPYLCVRIPPPPPPQIAVVLGSCTAGGAYVPTMCDEAVILHQSGSLYLAGPPLVRVATGEVLTSEELGGADVHCSISGCTDHFATSEEEAATITRNIVSSLNLPLPDASRTLASEPPLYASSDEDFADLFPETLEQPWPMLDASQIDTVSCLCMLTLGM